MSDSIFNFGRPRRRVEPQMSEGSGEDAESHSPDQRAAGRDPGADALKELARLIDQADPVPPAGHPDEGPPPGGRLADMSRTASAPGSRESFIRPPAREQARQDRLREDRSYDESFEGRAPSDKGASVRREPDFGRSRLPVQPHHQDMDHSEPPADNFDFLQLPDRDDYAVAPRHPMAGEEAYHDRDHHEGSGRHPQYGRQVGNYADEYHEYEYDEQDEEAQYDGEHEEPDHYEAGAKKRTTTRMAVAVLGLAVFGTAAAFGYRTIFKAAPSDSTPAPIIRADNSPTKITPVAADVNANAAPASAVFDDRSKEQVIPRDEEPVNVQAPYGAGAVGTVESSAPMSAPPRGTAALPGDPKRVRTVPIRADQSEASSSAATRSVPPPQSQPRVPPPTRQAAAAPQAPPSPPRQVAAAAPPSSSPAGDAKATPNVPEPAATRAIEAGGFVVQLSAQRSESDAQATFRTLQTKYPALSGREPLIRRKDLGERGIFFAAQVGPFSAKGEADQLCETLKSAGGTCFVQKN
jgi:hypothetical protein